MSPWTGALVQQALGLPRFPATAPWTAISTDTRSIEPGALFLALVGERFDGHNYLAAAREQGATAVVVRRGTAPVGGLELLEVDDTLRAYGDIARARRRLITGPVVCVTGNNGKTTVKEMVAAVLRTRFGVHATRANNNNLVGVPLTIIEAPWDVEALVIEGGGNVPGELPRYREIIEPTITIATNATEGHLEGYGSLAAIVADTIAVTAGVDLAVVGMEPRSLAEGARRVARTVITVGWQDADRIPQVLATDARARPRVRLGGQEVQLPLPGRHQALNAEFAWVVGEAVGIDADAAAKALATVTVPGGRSELSQVGRLTILNDCYNANPHSFAASIATAADLRRGRRLVFVAGTMRELGAEAARLHRAVAAQIVALDPELIAAVGEFVPAFQPWAETLGDRLITAADAPAMGPLLAARLRGDEVLVLKGSRGAALERILPAITGRAAAPH
jgi:UDP-N-acetylmuramoyl-tripeptide--D-alanyl-D-alanine ligase